MDDVAFHRVAVHRVAVHRVAQVIDVDQILDLLLVMVESLVVRMVFYQQVTF
jgi:hypothetical protein